jgi:hypothetical protein
MVRSMSAAYPQNIKKKEVEKEKRKEYQEKG